MTDKTKTRSIEVELPIDASPEAVWKALTDPEELARWFPFQARVEPGVGGAIALSWGPGMEGEGRIHEWEPGRHLRTGWFGATEAFGNPPEIHSATFRENPEAAARLLVDYHIEGRGGSAVLRLVHSGFSVDARWDEEFEAHHRGWNFELRSLRNYLEHHAGRPRHVAQVTAPVTGDASAAWRRLVGPDGLRGEGVLEGIGKGAAYSLTTVHGDRLQGELTNYEPPAEFAGTVENLGHALFRCGVETCWDAPTVQIWLSTWGDHRRHAAPFEARWKETFSELFPV